MLKHNIFHQRHDRGYFALFGQFEGVLIYLALSAVMVLFFLLTGEFLRGASLLPPLAVGLAVLVGLRYRLAGAATAGAIAVGIFCIAYIFGWGVLPEQGLFFSLGWVFLIYLFSFCASSVVGYHIKQHERSQQRENMLRLALDHAHIGFWSLEFPSKTFSCDANWYRLLGMDHLCEAKPLEIWRQRIHPDDEGRLNEGYRKYLETGTGTIQSECRVRNAEGDYIWVQERARVVEFYPDGSPKRMMGTTQHISEQKKIEMDLKQAKENAEVANSAKSQFIAAISHEIRTPLNAIIGLSSFLSESELEEEELDMAQTIHSSGSNLLMLVNDLLDFSKIEAGHLDLDVQEYPLLHLMEDCVKLFNLRASEKGIALTLNFDETLPDYALGDMQHLRQVVQNLLSNAIKFTDQGGVELLVRRVELSQLSEARQPDPLEVIGFLDQPDHEYLEVRVRDTGIGIAKSQQHLLFEAFSQVDASSKRKYEGTGLGLVICKRLVQGMGGRIWVDSELGRGAEFGFIVRTKLFSDRICQAMDDEATAADWTDRFALEHPCDLLIVGPKAATDPLVAACRKLGYAPHRSEDYALNGNAYRRRHYRIIFVWMEATGQALELVRKIRLDKIRLDSHVQRPDSLVGLLPDGSGLSPENCRLSGLQRVIQGEPLEPAMVARLIREELLPRG